MNKVKVKIEMEFLRNTEEEFTVAQLAHHILTMEMFINSTSPDRLHIKRFTTYFNNDVVEDKS